MNPALRPLSTSEILDRTFAIYRSNFLLFTGISCFQTMFFIAGMAATLIFGRSMPEGVYGPPAAIFFMVGLTGGVLILLFCFSGCALAIAAGISAVSRLLLGFPATIKGSYKEINPLTWRMLRVIITLCIRTVGTILIPALLLLLANMVTPGGILFFLPGTGWKWAASLLVLGSLVLWATRIGCGYSLAIPACLLEKLGAEEALRRSKALSQGSVGRIFCAFLLTAVLGIALGYVLGIPRMFFPHPYSVQAFMYQVASALAAFTVAFPVGTIALGLLYYDLRVRKEAFDLSLMMESIQPEGSTPANTRSAAT